MLASQLRRDPNPDAIKDAAAALEALAIGGKRLQGAAANGRLAEAAHLQAIESDPLTAEEVSMFEMFEREGWSPERRRIHILRRIEDRGRVTAAE